MNKTFKQVYSKDLDMTLIYERKREEKGLREQISGFYYGKPTLDGLEQFKDKNYIYRDEEWLEMEREDLVKGNLIDINGIDVKDLDFNELESVMNVLQEIKEEKAKKIISNAEDKIKEETLSMTKYKLDSLLDVIDVLEK